MTLVLVGRGNWLALHVMLAGICSNDTISWRVSPHGHYMPDIERGGDQRDSDGEGQDMVGGGVLPHTSTAGRMFRTGTGSAE